MFQHQQAEPSHPFTLQQPRRKGSGFLGIRSRAVRETTNRGSSGWSFLACATSGPTLASMTSTRVSHVRLLIATALSWIAAIAGGGAIAPGAAMGQPVVVHDTRGMVTSGTYDNFNHSCIGGEHTHPGYDEDSQTAAGFTLAARTRLTSLTGDWIEITSGEPAPADGFLVEVFANVAGDQPAESPSYSVAVSGADVVLAGLFPAGGIPDSPGSRRTTWTLDLTNAAIVLEAGTWWISATPRNDTSAMGSGFVWVGNGDAPASGLLAHTRCGGIAHGDSYGCWGGANTHPEWFAAPAGGGIFGVSVNVSMRLEGEVMGGGGVNACAADFNGSGRVDVQDIFDFLSAWFAGSQSADFDRSGGVTVQDIFGFLSAWFAGC